jgi:tRNA(fMet)-specific endonuclease VapC
MLGAVKGGSQNGLIAATKFLSRFPSLPFDDLAADHYAQIRADLERRGQPIGPNDMLVAAIAVANRLTIVTNNIREFSRVPGLPCEDWTLPIPAQP